MNREEENLVIRLGKLKNVLLEKGLNPNLVNLVVNTAKDAVIVEEQEAEENWRQDEFEWLTNPKGGDRI